MATVVQPRNQAKRPPKSKGADSSRELEILKEFESFFGRHISAMTPGQLREYEARVEKIVQEAKIESSESVSTHETEQSSLKVRSC